MIGLYPRRDTEDRISGINLKIAKLAGRQNIDFSDVGTVLLKRNGKIDESLFLDGLHPNSKGYDKLAPEITVKLKSITNFQSKIKY